MDTGKTGYLLKGVWSQRQRDTARGNGRAGWGVREPVEGRGISHQPAILNRNVGVAGMCLLNKQQGITSILFLSVPLLCVGCTGFIPYVVFCFSRFSLFIRVVGLIDSHYCNASVVSVACVCYIGNIGYIRCVRYNTGFIPSVGFIRFFVFVRFSSSVSPVS